MKQIHMKRLALAATLAGAAIFASPSASAQATPAPSEPATTPTTTTTTTQTTTTTTGEGAAATPPAAAAAAPESRVHAMPVAPPVQRRVTTPVIVAGAIGGVGLVSGVVFSILAAGDNSSYKSTPNHEVALSGERSAFIADVSFGVAALFGLTAIALYFLPDEPSPAGPAATTPAAKTRTQWMSAALKGEVWSF